MRSHQRSSIAWSCIFCPSDQWHAGKQICYLFERIEKTNALGHHWSLYECFFFWPLLWAWFRASVFLGTSLWSSSFFGSSFVNIFLGSSLDQAIFLGSSLGCHIFFRSSLGKTRILFWSLLLERALIWLFFCFLGSLCSWWPRALTLCSPISCLWASFKYETKRILRTTPIWKMLLLYPCHYSRYMQQKVIPQHGWKYSELCQASLNQLFAFHLKNLPAIPISKHPDVS